MFYSELRIEGENKFLKSLLSPIYGNLVILQLRERMKKKQFDQKQNVRGKNCSTCQLVCVVTTMFFIWNLL